LGFGSTCGGLHGGVEAEEFEGEVIEGVAGIVRLSSRVERVLCVVKGALQFGADLDDAGEAIMQMGC
jgi:hypothetical protein